MGVIITRYMYKKVPSMLTLPSKQSVLAGIDKNSGVDAVSWH